MPDIKTFFSREEQEAIIAAIGEAELHTSGEIRVHLENNCLLDPVRRARRLFVKLKMDRTKERNAVLLYIAVSSRKLAIIGDQAIDAKVPAGYWENVKEDLLQSFRKGEHASGLVKAIHDTGKHLQHFFPAEGPDANELSNDIHFGK